MRSSAIVRRLIEDEGEDFDLVAEIGNLPDKSDHEAYIASLRKQAPLPGASFGHMAMFVDSIDWDALIADDEGRGSYFLSDDSSGVACTGYARTIRSIFGPKRTELRGFMTWNNPESKIGQDCEGHDFAIVDGRFIVDPWAAQVETYDRIGVFDLKNKRTAARVRKLYGDPAKWRRIRR